MGRAFCRTPPQGAGDPAAVRSSLSLAAGAPVDADASEPWPCLAGCVVALGGSRGSAFRPLNGSGSMPPGALSRVGAAAARQPGAALLLSSTAVLGSQVPMRAAAVARLPCAPLQRGGGSFVGRCRASHAARADAAAVPASRKDRRLRARPAGRTAALPPASVRPVVAAVAGGETPCGAYRAIFPAAVPSLAATPPAAPLRRDWAAAAGRPPSSLSRAGLAAASLPCEPLPCAVGDFVSLPHASRRRDGGAAAHRYAGAARHAFRWSENPPGQLDPRR